MDVQEKKKILNDLTRVLKFELWLRFYFLKEEDGVFKLELSPEQMAKMRNEYGEVAELAEKMNSKELTPEVSQQLVVEFISEKYDGAKYDMEKVPNVMDSALFRAEVEAFNMWASLHEQQLDDNFLPFEKCLEAFEEWKKTEQAQSLITSLSMGQQATPSSKTSN